MTRPDAWIEGRLDGFRQRSIPFGPRHGEEWKDGVYLEARRQGLRGTLGARCVRLREDHPPLPLDLPAGDWSAPDFFTFGTFMFASARLREALALPPEDVQYFDIALMAGGTKAVAQDYRLLRPLRHQAAMDAARSQFRVYGELRNGPLPVGERQYITALAIRADLAPCADLFWVDEDPTTLLATDTLALRVIKARCTGIRFQDPTTLSHFDGIVRERSVRGVRVTKYW